MALRRPSNHAASRSVMLMKPGPATSTLATSGSARSLAAIASASSRGFRPASLASTMAALVAMSPWVGSRGGSTSTRDWSMPAGSTPSAIRASFAARTRARTSAKIFVDTILTFREAARLTQIRGRVKETAVLDKRVAIGHACDVVGDQPGAVTGVAGAAFGVPLGRQIGRNAGVMVEQVAHHPLRIPHDPGDAAVPVHADEQECLDGPVGDLHVGRETHHGRAGQPHVIGGARRRRGEPPAGFRNDVVD